MYSKDLMDFARQQQADRRADETDKPRGLLILHNEAPISSAFAMCATEGVGSTRDVFAKRDQRGVAYAKAGAAVPAIRHACRMVATGRNSRSGVAVKGSNPYRK